MKAYKNGSAQTIPNGTDTVVTFIDDFDPQNWFSSDRFQPTVAGYYSIQVAVWWDAGSVTNNQTNIQLRKNGSIQSAIQQNQILTGAGYGQEIDIILYLNGSTDYLEVTAFTGNTTSQNINGASGGTWFSAALITTGGYTGSTGSTGPTGPTGSSPTLSAGTGITLTGTPPNYTIENTFTTGCFGITIDGGGSVITTGLKGYIQIPYNCTITGWIVLPDQNSSIVVDVWKQTLLNFPPTASDSIAGTEKPTLLSADFAQDLALSTWITAVTAGDIIAFNVDSASVVTRATIQILTLRT